MTSLGHSGLGTLEQLSEHGGVLYSWGFNSGQANKEDTVRSPVQSPSDYYLWPQGTSSS